MMKTTSILSIVAIGLGLSTTGCAVPYFASVRGPIRGIRVIDAESNTDVPEAAVSLTSQTSERFLGPPPNSLICPSLTEQRAVSYRGVLKRNADQTFSVPAGLGKGSRGLLTGRPEDPNEYPRGIVIVTARGYRPALLRYTVGHVQPGWSCSETIGSGDSTSTTDNPPQEGDGMSFQGGRCEMGDDGILRFHLRPIKNEPSLPVSQADRQSSSPATAL
jgi:hypothetical protein